MIMGETTDSENSDTSVKQPWNSKEHVPVLTNKTLAATWIAMQSYPADAVISSLSKRCTSEEIKGAKKVLWDASTAQSGASLGRRKSRRDTQERTEREAHSRDIVDALKKLDNAGTASTRNCSECPGGEINAGFV